MTQFNDIRGYSLFTIVGDINIIGIQNPTQSYEGGLYNPTPTDEGGYKIHFCWYIVGIAYFKKLLQHGIFPSYICNFIPFNFDSFLIHILATFQ